MVCASKPLALWTARVCWVGLALALTLLASACGGGVDELAAPDAQARPSSQRDAPIAGDDGSLMPAASGAGLDEPAARARPGLLPTPPLQAGQLGRERTPETISIDADCCGPQGTVVAMQIVWGLQAARDLPNDTPVLVSGSDPLQSQALAQGLAAAGMSRVTLVAPP